MNPIDYRRILGLAYDDKTKANYFFAQMYNFFLNVNGDPDRFDPLVEQSFCNRIGMPMKKENTILLQFDDNDEPRGLQRAWIYLEKHQTSLLDFLFCYVMLINSYAQGRKKEKNILIDVLRNALDSCQISYETFSDEEGIYIIPKGAKEFDDALVSQPLEWLRDYPKAHKTYCVALKQYSEGIYIRDVADNLRKALEDFLREFLENEKDLNCNKKEAEAYLKQANANPQLVNMFGSLLTHYYLLNNDVAKHNDKVDKTYLEFLLYQTGIFIRTLIVVRQEKEEAPHAD